MKKTPFYFLLFLLIFLSVARPLKAQTSIIPDISEAYLTRLIETAKKNYPRVKSYENHITIAQSNIGRAKASFYDAFTFSYVYQPHSASIVNVAPATSGSTASTVGQSSYSYFNGIQAGLFFNLGNFLEKPYALRNAKEELKIARNDQDEYFLTLTTEVKKRYYVYIQRMAELKLQVQSALDAQQLMMSIKYKFEKGEETYDNYNKAQVTYGDRNQSRIAAETGLLSARADLEELVGDKLENIK